MEINDLPQPTDTIIAACGVIGTAQIIGGIVVKAVLQKTELRLTRLESEMLEVKREQHDSRTEVSEIKSMLANVDGKLDTLIGEVRSRK